MMPAISCIIVIYFSIVFLCKNVHCSEEFLKNYDVVDFEILDHRVKRTALETFILNDSFNDNNVEILFKSFSNKFHLILSKDATFRYIPVRSHMSDNWEDDFKMRADFYEGTLKNDPVNSSVLGFLLDDMLTAIINKGSQIYFIEPAKIFFNDSELGSRKITVYRNKDISMKWKILPKYPEDFPAWKILSRAPNVTNITIENSGIDVSNLTEDVFCDIEIVADHTLHNFYNNDTDRLVAMLYFHGKFADYVFRNTDFDMDGNPDGIRIAVEKISIYKSIRDKNYPMSRSSSLTDYLTKFSLRRQDSEYCLSLSMFYRQFQGIAIGEAFRAQERFTNALGGICDRPVPQSNFNSASFNTGVINVQFQNGRTLPLGITMMAFAHEIGHGFGSGHDPLEDPICSPGSFSNKYLMYPVPNHNSQNSMQFSPCSKEKIRKILLLKGDCLKYKEPQCGNGIREGDEECDCGPSTSCDLLDSCCTPSDAKPPEKGCHIRSSKNYRCSPRESECCTNNCSLVTDPETVCYRDEFQCSFGFCDGKSAKCPNPEKKPESYCRPKFFCENSTCYNSTVCSSQDLLDCVCKQNITVECLQCCLKDDVCVPASELGDLNLNGQVFILEPGSSCNNGQYLCDDTGNCTNTAFLLRTSFTLYVSTVTISFFIAIWIFLAMFFSCQRNTRNVVPLSNNM